MPTLPSGRSFALSKKHIFPPGVVTFTCPEGHFWFQQLDRKISPPPLKPDEQAICSFVHAPCPTTRAEALASLHILENIGPGPEKLHWRGYTLADPEALADLTPEDRIAWDAWTAEQKVGEFLDKVISECRAQAEANRKNLGFMVFRGQQPKASNDK